MHDLKPIRNEEEYELALQEASLYFDLEPTPGTKKGDRFEILLILIESYESKFHKIQAPDSIEAIKFVSNKPS